jgi:Cu(I)/Ag(I) efflux system membrane fusion protein
MAMTTKTKAAIAATLAALAVAAAGGAACRRSLSAQAAAPVAAPAAQRYHCPMHPGFVSEAPGDCPICGMDLVPVAAAPAAPAPAAGPAGRAAVTLSPERRRLLGMQGASVRRRPLVRDIRASGRVAVDERRLHHVHARFDAYVEHLHVDFIGRFVRKGEPLLSLYSPDLVATQQEYLLAWRAQAATVSGGAGGAADLLAAARQRLLLWDIRPGDIERLETSGTARRTLDLHAPVGGYVVRKTAFHGMRVTPADTLFDIADLSSVWVLADVYESDLGAVGVGTPAELSLSYVPGRSWTAAVTQVAPFVDERTRTVQVRLEVDNRAGLLKPEMFADVVLRAGSGQGLVVPVAAVVRAGERDLVFVERPGGALEPRTVRLGGRVGEGQHVVDGLAEGETVATPAHFLLDSESSLRSALAAWSPGDGPGPGEARR